MTVYFYALFLKDIVLSRLGVLSAPFKYTLVLTKRCNSKCRNCLIWTEKADDELAIDEYRRIAKKSPNLKWLNLTGGEITLRKDVLDIVRVFKEHCPHLRLLNFTTNGLDVDCIVTIAKALSQMNFLVLNINVSLDGDQETHDRLRGVPGNFRSALKAFSALRELRGVSSYLSFTVYDSNFSKFELMLAEAQRHVPAINKDDFHLNLENNSAHYYRHRSDEISKKFIDEKKQIFKNQSQFSPRIFISLRAYFKFMYNRLALKFMDSGIVPMLCQAMVNSIYISEKGVVYPCLVWSEVIGELRNNEYDVAAVLRNNRAVSIRSYIKSRSCKNCWTPCEAYSSLLSRPFGV